MLFSATKSDERGNWKISGGTEYVVWIWRTNMQFRAPGVSKFFEMAYEKLFQVTVC